MCTSNKPKAMNTKASCCSINELHTDDCITASWLGKRVTRERLYIFRLVLTAIKDWGETNCNTLSYSSCHALMSGRLLDSSDNVQMTLYPDATKYETNTEIIHNRRIWSLNKSWGTHFLKYWYICQYGEMWKIRLNPAKTFLTKFSCPRLCSASWHVSTPIQFICCIKPQPNDPNNSTQHIAKLLGAACCVRLATLLRLVATCCSMLGVVGSNLKMIKFLMKHLWMFFHSKLHTTRFVLRTLCVIPILP